MRLRSILLIPLLLAGAAGAEARSSHPCAADALKRAEKLLKLHVEGDDRATVDPDSVKDAGTVAALVGKGRFDVLEVTGSVYKADYSMHLIYARIPGDCVLMGEEILERSNPY